MINLNEIDNGAGSSNVVIFNNGKAGRVKSVKVEVIKKTPEDNQNGPDFRINYIDSDGGVVNDGIFYTKDTDTPRQKEINLSRIMSVLYAVDPTSKTKTLPEFDDYNPAIDYVMKSIAQASKSSTVNVFVAYGTNNTPSKYLRVRKFNFIEPSTTDDAVTRLTPKVSAGDNQWDDLMERIQPTEFKEDSITTESTSDSGLDDW